MIIERKHLPRRTFLRGLGTAVALPVLDAMSPALAAPNRLGAKTPCRLAFVYVPNGIDMRYWTPSAEGKDYELTRMLEPIAPVKNDVLVLSGLMQNGGRALGDGPGDHARAAASFLTGVHPYKTAGADIRNGISVDQVAAQKIGGDTRFRSLELGLEDGRQVGNCDSGYSCAYSNSIAWRSEATPLPPDINPRVVFERLFAGFDLSETPAQRAKRARQQKSILDFVLEDTARLQGELGKADRRKLDEYLAAVREIEQRIQAAEKTSRESGIPDIEKPAGVPLEYSEHASLMHDLMTVAFQADLTRVITFMMGREGSTRPYREIGISDAHHPLTHHQEKPEMMEKVARINRYHMEQFGSFLAKLKAAPDGDGSLLDHSMIIYGSGLADGNKHTHHDLPVLLAGRGLGTLNSGRHVVYQRETPMANLFLSMLDRAGVPTESLGDANGKLDHLTDL